MQKRWLVLFIALLSSCIMLLGACGGSTSENPDGDTIDPDTALDGDTAFDGELVEHTNCDGACRADKGFYCDEATQSCLLAKATACIKANEAYFCKALDPNAKCLTVKVGTADPVDICAKPCTADTDCNTGYETCKANSDVASGKYCQPFITITTSTPGSLPGGPCEYGSLWPGRSCMSGDSCVGNAAMVDAVANMGCARNIDCAKDFVGTPTCDEGSCNCMFSCTKNADCAAYGAFGGTGVCQNGNCAYSCDTNADCSDYFGGAKIGYCDPSTKICGFALCVTPCLLNGCCPDLGLGMDLYPELISGTCYCGPGPFFSAPAGQTKAPYCIVEAPAVDGDADTTPAVKECIYADDYCDDNAKTATPLSCSGCNKCDNAQHKCVPKTPECADDSQCATDYTCRKTDVGEEMNCGGTCRKKVCPTDFSCGECGVCLSSGVCKAKAVNCSSNSDCSSGRYCDMKCGGQCTNGTAPECDASTPCTDPCKSCSTEGKCVAKTPECSESTPCSDSAQKCDTAVCGGTCVAKKCPADITCTACQTCNASGACEDKTPECTALTGCELPKVCNILTCGGTCEDPIKKKFKATKLEK